jgi:DNA-binding MarR family transcriptional regulator
MTATQAPAIRFGELLGTARRYAAATFDQLLKDAETPFEEWIAMTLLTRMGGVSPKTDLASDIADRIDSDVNAITDILNQMIGKNLLREIDADGATLVELTAEGTELYRALGAQVDEIGAFELSTSTPEDIEAARRVLSQFIEQAKVLAARQQ